MSKNEYIPTIPKLNHAGFELVGESFGIPDVERVSGARLKQLFHPQTIPLEKDRKAAAAEAKELFKKQFFAAQLRYYDIHFGSADKVATLREQLCDAVDQGRVSDSCTKTP